jgi:hypothetical protein
MLPISGAAAVAPAGLPAFVSVVRYAAISIDLGQWSAPDRAFWQRARNPGNIGRSSAYAPSHRKMFAYFDNPFAIFAVAFVAQVIAALVGDLLRKRAHSFQQGERHDFGTVQNAALTLLGLIIGFSFSMAVTRYDQRKAPEEAEANAIGTEYLRANLLPDDSAVRTCDLLRKYVALRVAFYQEDGLRPAAEIGQQTASVQGTLWSQSGVARNCPSDTDDRACRAG